jgi:hypothetical protein
MILNELRAVVDGVVISMLNLGALRLRAENTNGRNNTEVLALSIHFLSTIGSGAEDHTNVRHFRDFLTGDAVPALDYS